MIFLLNLAGYVALLLWGIHMIHTGLQRAFGTALTSFLERALSQRLQAFGAGLVITAALQSSTASGLIIVSLVSGGAIALTPALAAMLGANVGTTLIVQVLSFDLSALAPILILTGVVLFRRQAPGPMKDSGRSLIGLGLILLSLHHLVILLAPVQQSSVLSILLHALSAQPFILVVLAAILTWMAHSSVVIVVLIMSLAGHHQVAVPVAFALVVGANVGSALNPLLERSGSTDPAGKQLPFGNLLTRLAGMLLMFLAYPWVEVWSLWLADDPARAVANFHTLFNLVVALVFLPILKPFARTLEYWFPQSSNDEDPALPRYLEKSALEIPSVALGNAAREALRVADMLNTLLLYSRSALKRDNWRRQKYAKDLGRTVTRLQAHIVEYLVCLQNEEISSADQRRLDDILLFVDNIGHAAATVELSLLAHTSKLKKKGHGLNPEQHKQLENLLNRLVNNLKHTVAVFLDGDITLASNLVAEKNYFRDQDVLASEMRLQAIRPGQAEMSEVYTSYIELVRDMKTINSHLIDAAAYPVFFRKGQAVKSN